MKKIPLLVDEQVKMLEEKILETAERLNIDLSNESDREALKDFAEDVELFSDDNGDFNIGEYMDGQTDATYFLSMAINLLDLIRNASLEKKIDTLGETFFLAGLVSGIIGNDRTNVTCPTCIAKSYASHIGKRGADTVHDKPNGSRAKRSEIQKIWASGKYSSRDICAEQECASLGMSFSTARKALRGTPDPI